MSILPEISALLQLIGERDRFLITSHARPDGDAIGSSLGMLHLLEGMGKTAQVAFSDPIPKIFCMLPGADRILSTLPEPGFDALIVLECDSFERTGFSSCDFASASIPFTINIDHHLSGREYADYNWIDPQCCAVGAMVYDLAVASGVDITPEMATCLYTAVLTDTGSFTYRSTVASTFALAQHLVERGANPTGIAQSIYYSNPASRFFLLGQALQNLHVEGPLAWAWVTQEQITAANAAVEDCEGVVNHLISIAEVEAAVFLRELPDGQHFRLSIRSKDLVDVARIAESLGGGGHRSASGCTLDGPLESALQLILKKLAEPLDKLAGKFQLDELPVQL